MKSINLNSLVAVGILSILIAPIFLCEFKAEDSIKEENAVMEFSSVNLPKDKVKEKDKEEVIHTHIWATTYDSEKHWEYCTVCERIRHEHKHKMVDNWFFGYPSCHISGDNYSTRICECGYNYIYRKPHGNISGWYNTGVRMVHYKKCDDCHNWTASEKCYDDDGHLGCHNPGKCKVCGIEATEKWHYITRADDGKGGKCRDCGKLFFTIEDYSLSYTDDYSAAIIQFKFVPTEDSVEFTGLMGAYCGNSNYTSDKWTYVINEDRSCNYTGVYTFDKNKQRKSNLYFLDRTGAIKVDGQKLYIDSNIMYETIWQDHIPASLSNVKQVDQAVSGDWATIKELTFNGSETLAKIVSLTIKDKLTGDVIVSGAKVNVTDEDYEYKCTPAIEGPVEGRDYVLVMTDGSSNVKEEIFTIYRTDSRAPLLTENAFDQWSQSKTVAIPMTDYGVGKAQTSLDNQYSYKDTVYKDGVYYGMYYYPEENYGVEEHTLYVRDGLGNARRDYITIGRIDNTKPTIVRIEPKKVNNGITLKLTTDDYSRQMKKQGSGVNGYAITTTAYQPTKWQEENGLKITEAGLYYVWAKDKAGNIADFRIVQVDESMNIRLDNDPPVIDDKVITEEHIVRHRGERYIYGYYSYDMHNKVTNYLRADNTYVHMFGENNNEENMYMYFSSSKDKVLTKQQLKGYTFDSQSLIKKLKSDKNMIDWSLKNTRTVDKDGALYKIQGNNVCYLEASKEVEDYMGDDDSAQVYVHIITESCVEYVEEVEVVKRVLFSMH